MVDLIKAIVWQKCQKCFGTTREEAEECFDSIDREYQFCSFADRFIIDDIEYGLKEWLSSFDTSSATECFTAVNILKERLYNDL